MEIKDLLKIVYHYYPSDIDFWNSKNNSCLETDEFKKICLMASIDIRWLNLKKRLTNKELNFLDFSTFTYTQHSFFGSLINYVAYTQLILRISAIAPVYTLYFLNYDTNWEKIGIRLNTISVEEADAKSILLKSVKENFKDYMEFDKEGFFTTVETLGKINILRPRKPYLDECIFGTYISIHD